MPKSRVRDTIAAAAFAAFALPAAAWHDGPPGARGLAWACHRDYARLCHGVPFGGGRVVSCLTEQYRDLSERCYRALEIAETIEACTPDRHRFCAGVAAGAGRILACLSGNSDRLSRRCHETLAETVPYALHSGHASHRPPSPGADRREPDGPGDEAPYSDAGPVK